MSAVVAVPRVTRFARRVRVGRCILVVLFRGVDSWRGLGGIEDLERCDHGFQLIYRWE